MASALRPSLAHPDRGVRGGLLVGRSVGRPVRPSVPTTLRGVIFAFFLNYFADFIGWLNSHGEYLNILVCLCGA